MVTAVIVLFVVALALGGYLAFDFLHDRKKVAVVNEQSAAKPQSTEEAAPEPAAEQPAVAEAPVRPEPELAVKSKPSVAVLEQSEIRESVAAAEVDKIMSDDVAASFIEQSGGTTDRTKQGIINIDTLGQCFESGETVTLDEIKKRVKGFNQKTTYLKVLARGTLDKPLTVEADNFSLQAVKMIVLTGGKAIKN